MKKPEIIAYISRWHQTQSPAFKLILESLKDYATFDFQDLSRYDPDNQANPIIFCQTLPRHMPPATPKYPVTWIPMADNFLDYDSDFWENLNRNIKIFALSSLIGKPAKRASLKTFEATFYLNPDDFPVADWSNGFRLMYWNRSALVGKKLLYQLCEQLNVNELYFRDKVDSIYPSAYYSPSASKLKSKLTLVNDISNRSDYLKYLEKVNIFIAPRPVEGVGLTFLEAMASGCAIIAPDFPTMNEYITDGVDGILLPLKPNILYQRRERYLETQRIRKIPIIGRYLAYIMRRLPEPIYLDVDLDKQDNLDSYSLSEIGKNARENHYKGYMNWLHKRKDIVEFLTT